MAQPHTPASKVTEVVSESEPVAKVQSPMQWRNYGLIGLGIVIAVLLILQLLMGAPGSAVQPGTPTAAPVVQTPVAPQQSTDGQ